MHFLNEPKKREREEETKLTFRPLKPGICPWRISREECDAKDRVLDTETVIFLSMNAATFAEFFRPFMLQKIAWIECTFMRHTNLVLIYAFIQFPLSNLLWKPFPSPHRSENLVNKQLVRHSRDFDN